MQKTLSQQRSLLRNDENYFEESFKIGALFQKKRLLIQSMQKQEDPSEEKKDARKITGPASAKKIRLLNDAIKKKSLVFWKKVKHSKLKGKRFVFEEFAQGHNLDAFEKTVLLFFVYLELFCITKNKCWEDDLLKVFELDNSALERMRHFLYFSKEGTLIKNRILSHEGYIEKYSARVFLALTDKMLKDFSKMLNGQTVDFKISHESELNEADKVGFVKQPQYTLDDVMLDDVTKKRLLFFLNSHNHDQFVSLGIFEKIKKSKGMTFLFYGPPGTGKSMLAEAVADYLKKKILIVEAAKIFSQHVGETDKQISKMFRVAKEKDLVLCLDEADSLFYNRTFAFQDHDIRFVNDMLQELERFEGIAVFTTNMENLLDLALERRISFKVKLELPDEKIRSQIWQSHIPPSIKVSEDIDFSDIAKRYNFSGGYIKNAVMHAMRRLALEEKNLLTAQDLFFGADMEYEGVFSKESRKGTLGFDRQ